MEPGACALPPPAAVRGLSCLAAPRACVACLALPQPPACWGAGEPGVPPSARFCFCPSSLLFRSAPVWVLQALLCSMLLELRETDRADGARLDLGLEPVSFGPPMPVRLRPNGDSPTRQARARGTGGARVLLVLILAVFPGGAS